MFSEFEVPVSAVNHIDEQPVGKQKQNTMLDEYPPGYDPNEQMNEVVQVPLKIRMKSKIFKQRQSAFEEMITIFTNSQPQDEPLFQGLSSDEIIGFIQDSNPGAQEKGLQVTQLWLSKQDKIHETIDLKAFIKSLIEKCLCSPKQNIKQISQELLFILFERGCKSTLIEQIIMGCGQKNPKIVCSAVNFVVELIINFGVKKLDLLKPFWNIMEELSQIRNHEFLQGSNLMDILKILKSGKWLGKSIEQFLQKLKKAQLDEIMNFINGLSPDNLVKPLRGGDEVNNNQKGSADYDAYDLADPVDILNKFPESWCERTLGIEKWSERKEALDILLKSSQTPKINSGNQNQNAVTQMLKKLLQDKNQAIQITAIKIISSLANGLRKNFTQSGKILLQPLIVKLKDKKQSVIDEVHLAFKKLFYSLNLDNIFDDIKELMDDKSPSTKINILIVIENYFESQNKQNLQKQVCIRNLIQLLKRFIDDGSLDVREKIIVLLAKIQAKIYDGTLKKDLADLRPDKVAKINNLAQNYLAEEQKNSNEITIPAEKSIIQIIDKKIQLNEQVKPLPPVGKVQNSPKTIQVQQNSKVLTPKSKSSLPQRKIEIPIQNNQQIINKLPLQQKPIIQQNCEQQVQQITQGTVQNQQNSFKVPYSGNIQIESNTEKNKFQMEGVNPTIIQVQDTKIIENLKQFQILSEKVAQNDTSTKNYISQIIEIALMRGNEIFLLNETQLVSDYCASLQRIITTPWFSQNISYSKFQQLIQWILEQMIYQVQMKDLFKQKILNALMLKILSESDTINLYIALIDIITEQQSSKTNDEKINLYIQVITRCLNKVLTTIQKKIPTTSLTLIIDRFQKYLSKFYDSQYNDINCEKRIDNFIPRVLKTAVMRLSEVNDPEEIKQILIQIKANQNSIIFQWVQERLDHEQQNQKSTSKEQNSLMIGLASKRIQVKTQNQIIESQTMEEIFAGINQNDSRFEQHLDNLIYFLRKNKGFDWYSHVQVNHPRIEQIKQKIEYYNVSVNLEKKVGQLETFIEQMNQ